jgi:hypothetical protein
MHCVPLLFCGGWGVRVSCVHCPSGRVDLARGARRDDAGGLDRYNKVGPYV